MSEYKSLKHVWGKSTKIHSNKICECLLNNLVSQNKLSIFFIKQIKYSFKSHYV